MTTPPLPHPAPDAGPSAAATSTASPAACTATGRWFDGLSTQPRPVAVRLVEGPTLEIQGLDLADTLPGASPSVRPPPLARWPLRQSRFGETWQAHPHPVQGPDGSTLWLDARHAAQARQWAQLAQQRPREPLVQRWIASWRAAVAALVCAMAVIVWFDRVGAGWLAQAMLPLIPRVVEENLSKQLMLEVNQRWPPFSSVPRERRDRIVERFQAVARAMEVPVTATLQFRRDGNGGGFNAMALPDGHIILFDGLTEALTDDELMAVLGHELGHVVHRHGMQRLMRGAGLLTVAGVALGDFSSVLSGMVGGLQTLHYSRDDEREADAYGRQFVAAAGLTPDIWLSVWGKFREVQDAQGGGEVPAWMSTHPTLDERLKEAEAAAGR
jgi:Zn-dependent protease with chaperone function